ncbi:MAG: LysR substrate-binding domain-containing protein [Gammaproteobacteria bacterium]|nr:LysR substrate-binding domain-containing protein [Gammaproteobacteria bacterium]
MIFNQHHTANTFSGTVAMAKAGLGVAITADFSVRQELEEGTLVDVFPGQTFFDNKVRLMYRRRTFLPKVMELFKEFIRDRYAQFP